MKRVYLSFEYKTLDGELLIVEVEGTEVDYHATILNELGDKVDISELMPRERLRLECDIEDRIEEEIDLSDTYDDLVEL